MYVPQGEGLTFFRQRCLILEDDTGKAFWRAECSGPRGVGHGVAVAVHGVPRYCTWLRVLTARAHSAFSVNGIEP